MASRNQNRPPRSPSNTVPSEKRRRIGTERMNRQGNTGRGRQPFASVNKGPEANRANDVVSTEGSECSIVDYTKEEVDALINEKFKKGNPFDNKKKIDQMGDYIRRVRPCLKMFQKREESYIEEKEKLQSALESAEKRCSDNETEMKNKIEELSKTIFSLEERISKEESLKLEAMERLTEEKETRSAAEKMQVSLSTELEKVKQEKLEAEKKAKSNELLYNSSKEYNMDLQRYNSRLQSDLQSTSDSLKELEKEKTAIVQNLSDVRGHNKTLQGQLAAIKASREEATEQKDALTHELSCLREELKQIRDDRDRQQAQIQALTGEVAYYKEFTGNSCAQLDNLTSKIKDLEDTCSFQRDQINRLQHQLTAEKDKLKIADLSALETRTSFEEQRRIISELRDRLADKEFQVIEGEKLRKVAQHYPCNTPLLSNAESSFLSNT